MPTKRLLDINFPTLSGEWLLIHLQGEDYISVPYSIEVIVASTTSVDKEALFYQEAQVSISPPEQSKHYFHGYVYHAQNLQQATPDGYYRYKLLIRPWLCFMDQRAKCAIYAREEPMTLPQVIRAVVASNNGLNAYDDSGLIQDYSPTQYIIQYNETDYNFIHRLCLQAGIYYTITHQQNAHTLVLHDSGLPSQTYTEPLIHDNRRRSSAYLSAVETHNRSVVAQIKHQLYDPEQPTQLITSASPVVGSADIDGVKAQTLYHYGDKPSGVSESLLSTQIKQRSGGYSVKERLGSGNYAGLWAGMSCAISTPLDGDGSAGYTLYTIRHEASDLSQFKGQRQTAHESSSHYHSSFRAYPSDVLINPHLVYTEEETGWQAYEACHPLVQTGLYKQHSKPNTNDEGSKETLASSQRKAPDIASISRPRLNAIHLAEVTGLEKHDVYADSANRIKVQFLWDSEGKGDIHSSAWLRTPSAWQGVERGIEYPPRVGSVGFVGFEQGHPERGYWLGNIYKVDDQLAFPTEESAGRSGIKTHTFGSENKSDGHELCFDDTANAEQMHLKSQKDITMLVKGSSHEQVNANRQLTVKGGDSHQEVKGKLHIEAQQQIRLNCGNSAVIVTPSAVTLQSPQITMNVSPPQSPPPSDNIGAKHQMMDKFKVEKSAKVYLLYATMKQTFYALTPAQFDSLSQNPEQLKFQGLMQQLSAAREMSSDDQANNARQQNIAQIKTELNKHLKEYVNGKKGTSKVRELVCFNTSRWLYLSESTLNQLSSAWQSYKADSESALSAIISGTKESPIIDVEPLSVKLGLTGEKKLALSKSVEVQGALVSWTWSMDKQSGDPKIALQDKSHKKRNLNIEVGAQLCRYTAGLSGAVNFDMTKLRLGMNAEAHASFALAQAHAGMKFYIPRPSGWQLMLDVKQLVENSHTHKVSSKLPQKDGKLNFGCIRILFDARVSLFVGASAMACVAVDVGMSDNSGTSKSEGNEESASSISDGPMKHAIKIRGRMLQKRKTVTYNKGEADPSGKSDQVDASVNAFAGAELGGNVGATLSWLNPDKSALPSEKTETTLKTSDSWSDFASLAAEGDVAAGIGGDGEFRIGYDSYHGKFFVHAKLEVVWGLGASGAMTVVVYPGHITSFVAFVYHKLMGMNYQYIGYIVGEAFNQLNLLLARFIMESIEKIKDAAKREVNQLEYLATHEMKSLEHWFQGVVNSFNENTYHKIIEVAQAINAHAYQERLKHTTPEVKGHFLYILTEYNRIILHKRNKDEISMVEEAILHILSYIQSLDEYNNVLEHMTLNMSGKVSRMSSESRLYIAQGIYSLSDRLALKKFKTLLDGEDSRVYPSKVNPDMPVIANELILSLL